MHHLIIINDSIRFEPTRKSLTTAEGRLQISAPASYCLCLLIEKRGELVTHDELYQYAWRQFGMEATANTLYQNISVIRRALEQCGLDANLIRTMPRRGFILSVELLISYVNAGPETDFQDKIYLEADSSGYNKMINHSLPTSEQCLKNQSSISSPPIITSATNRINTRKNTCFSSIYCHYDTCHNYKKTNEARWASSKLIIYPLVALVVTAFLLLVYFMIKFLCDY